MSKELAKKEDETRELAVYDYGEDTGVGFEGQSADTLQIPFLSLLQDGSKAVKEKGFAPGTFFNTVTEECLGEEVFFVPAHVEHVYVEWVPRKKGGGFVGIHQKNSTVVVEARRQSADFGKYATEEGNDLVETLRVYGALCLSDGDVQPIVIPFWSTKIGVYRKWNTRVTMFTVAGPGGKKIKPPRYAHLVKLTSAVEERDSGDSFNYVMSPAKDSIKASLLLPSDERFIAAKAFAEMVKVGTARAADESLVTNGSGEEEVF